MKLLNNPIVYEKDKEGNQIINSFTKKPQCRVLATFEGDNKQRMGFINDVNLAKSWKEGDDLNVILSETVKGDKTFYNFKLAGKNDELKLEITKLKDFIRELIKQNGLKIPVKAVENSKGTNTLPTPTTLHHEDPVASHVEIVQDNNINIPKIQSEVERDEISMSDIPF